MSAKQQVSAGTEPNHVGHVGSSETSYVSLRVGTFGSHYINYISGPDQPALAVLAAQVRTLIDAGTHPRLIAHVLTGEVDLEEQR